MGTLSTRLADALVALTPEHPEAIERLRDLYDPSMVFHDPIQEVLGIEPFLALNRRFVGRMRTLTWTIESQRGDEEEVFLEWTMRGAAKLGPSMTLSAVTRAKARDGRIFDHRDYWDMGELVASALPGGNRILHALRAPFA